MFDWLFGRTSEDSNRHAPPERTPPMDAGPSLDRDAVASLLADETEHLEARLDTLTQQIRQLADQAAALHDQLDRLDHRTSFGNEQIETLTQHLSDVAGWADPLDQRLAELVTWAEQSQDELSQLHDDLRKLSRTQFKTNSLTEAQQERLQSALDTLQDLAARKQEAADRSYQEQQSATETARREARVALVADLFPALDGLESAMDSGRALLERSRQRTPRPDFLTRLAYAFGRHDLPAPSQGVEAMRAWLDGLELVRERFLALLRSEGIQPIHAEGKSFDPHFHVAVEAVEQPDVAPGTVLEEHRPGYRLGDRVLRYAEVVVVRDQQADEPTETPQPEEPGKVELEEPVEAFGSGEVPWGQDETEPAEPESESVTAELWTPATDGGKEPESGEPEAQGESDEVAELWTPVSSQTEEPAGPEETEEPWQPASDQAEKPEESREPEASDDESDDERPSDPEIEKMIARFEERRRSRQEE